MGHCRWTARAYRLRDGARSRLVARDRILRPVLDAGAVDYRMRAELGTPVHDLHFTGPDWSLTDLIGPRTIGPGNMAALSCLFWFNRAYRCQPMPAQLEGIKMAEMSDATREYRKWFWALL